VGERGSGIVFITPLSPETGVVGDANRERCGEDTDFVTCLFKGVGSNERSCVWRREGVTVPEEPWECTHGAAWMYLYAQYD
jgi:hypothetical protein